MKFRINNRFHTSLRKADPKSTLCEIERPRATERGEDIVPLGFLEFDANGFISAVRSTKNFIFFPNPISPDIRQHQPFMTDFDYRIEVSPVLRLAVAKVIRYLRIRIDKDLTSLPVDDVNITDLTAKLPGVDLKETIRVNTGTNCSDWDLRFSRELTIEEIRSLTVNRTLRNRIDNAKIENILGPVTAKPRADLEKPSKDGYYRWLDGRQIDPETGSCNPEEHTYFTETTVCIADRFIKCADSVKPHKYRVLRVETIGTVQDIQLHDIENVH